MTENSLQEEPRPARKNTLQIGAIILVLAVFVIGGVIYSEWHGGIFGESAENNAIAVLPFQNVNQDGYAGTIADNLTESLINEISQNSALRVIPRSEVFRYRGKNEDPRATGKTLKARLVLTGRVIREGDNLIIKTELVEVENKSPLWGNQYNVPVSEVMKLPGEISREVIAAAGPRK